MFAFSRGMSAYKNNEFDKAFDFFTKAAQKNDLQAAYMLGRCYHLGQGTAKNHELAIIWYGSAFLRGHKQAQQAIKTLKSEKALLQKQAVERLLETRANIYESLLQSISDNEAVELNLTAVLYGGNEYQHATSLQTWVGHTNRVTTLAVLPDGSLVSGSHDKTLRRWDSQSGQCLSIWKGHTDAITALAVLPDGSIVSGGWDNTLRHWDSQSGHCLSVWEGHTDAITALAVLPDGSIVSGGWDNTLRHWDSHSGRCFSVWEGHTNWINALAVLPDGSLVSGSHDKTLRRWDPQSGQCTNVWQGRASSINILAVLADGSVISGGTFLDDTLRCWEPQSGQCLNLWRRHSRQVTALAVLPDGSIISGDYSLLGGGDIILRHWDPHSERCLSVWSGHTHWTNALAVLPDGSLVSGSDDHTLLHWPAPPKIMTLEQLEGVLEALKDNRTVQTLTLSGVILTPTMTQTLAKVIAHHPCLTTLSLECCGLTDEDVKPFLDALNNLDCRVTQLNVSRNPDLSQEAQKALEQVIVASWSESPPWVKSNPISTIKQPQAQWLWASRSSCGGTAGRGASVASSPSSDYEGAEDHRGYDGPQP